MKLSLRAPDLSDEFLTFAAQFGVTHVRAMVEWFLKDGRGPADADAMRRAQDKANTFGLHIGGALIPQAKGSQIWHIRLGTPEREQEIRDVCQTLEAMGKADIRVAEYVFNIQAVHGVGPHEGPDRAGRGGATQVWFDYGRVKDELPDDPRETATADQMWERIEYFLRGVLPAAEAAGVRLACHPNDPPVPHIKGEDRVLCSMDAMKRLIELVPSECNGLNFCQGTFAEMGEDVVEAVRYFGSRDKINMVHFRNVRGRVPHYVETFIDDGDVDMLAAMRAFKEVGFTGMLMPDHSPRTIGDTDYGHRGRAFALGYIKALMKAVGYAP